MENDVEEKRSKHNDGGEEEEGRGAHAQFI